MLTTPDPALEILRLLLASYEPPVVPFDATGEYRLEYLLLGNPIRKKFFNNGSFSLARRREGDEVRLEGTSARASVDGLAYFVDFSFFCLAGPLASPRAWTASSRLGASAGAEPFPGSALERKGCIEGDRLVISTRGKSAQIDLTGAFTAKWCLFEAVMRLDRLAHEKVEGTVHGTRLEFSLVDEVDEVLGRQSLCFYKEVTVDARSVAAAVAAVPTEAGFLPARTTAARYRLRGWAHTGEGVLPTVYWIDERGAVLFATSGIEAFVLRNGPVADCISSTSEHEEAHREEDRRRRGTP